MMKKILSIFLVSVMILTVLAGCAKTDTATEALKFGLGVYTTASASDAVDEENAGFGQATVTAAAVLVDSDGKIVKAFVDCAESKVSYTVKGAAITNESFATKYEMGNEYNMVVYGGASKEWFEQADAFCSVLIGKTADEVKALVADDGKGNADVINAGCTIYVADFAKAVDKAMRNASESDATENDTLRLGMSTTQTTTDATADTAGINKIETTLFAAAIDSDERIVAASSDSTEVSFTFDVNGRSTFDSTKEILSKKEQGNSYGLVAYGGASKEWFEQAAIFDEACVGKTVSEINGLMREDQKGDQSLQDAGCTIYVSGFVKAASKTD